MRVVSRSDFALVAGLAAAMFVIVSPALERFFDVLREIEESRGLRLLPALVILASVFAFHQLRKRHQMHAAALAAAAHARQATERAAEMERLVAFGQALARSLDEGSIQAAVAAHIPQLAPGRTSWVLVREGTQWKTMAITGAAGAATERAARAALGETGGSSDAAAEFAAFPMIVAGTPVGVLGVAAHPTLGDEPRRTLTAAAALLAVSIKNAQLFREVHENSVRDSLTGCFNRRHALEVIEAELRRARRSQMPLSMVMFDLDHFKRINDRHGHLGGDAVLAEVGARMKAFLRGSDLKCRYGGEEFLIVLPDTPLSGACRVAETLRREIEQRPVMFNGQPIAMTASFGVAAITPGEIDPLAIMARADGALYRAKDAGRNTICVADEDAAPVTAGEMHLQR